MSTQMFDQAREISHDQSVSTNIDVLDLLSQKNSAKSDKASDLPKIDFIDSSSRSEKGGCTASEAKEPANKFKRKESDWLNDGSIDPKDAMTLEKVFSMMGNKEAVNKINSKLKDDGSNYRLRLGEKDGDQQTINLNKINEAKCGPRESLVDSAEITVADKERPENKLEKDDKPKKKVEKEEKPELEKFKKMDNSESNKRNTDDVDAFITALQDGSFDTFEDVFIMEHMTRLNHTFGTAGEEHFIKKSNEILAEAGSKYRLRAAKSLIKQPGHRRMELVDTSNPGPWTVADSHDYYIKDAQRW